MPDDPATFKTPDPLGSSEAIGAIVIALITNVIVLFQLNLSDPQRAAITGVVNAIVAAAVLYHGSRVRAGRAIGNAVKR